MQYHCTTQNSLWPVFPQQQTQPNIHNLEGAFRGAPYPSLHLPTSCEAQFLSCRLIQISPTQFLFFFSSSPNCHCRLRRATQHLFSEESLICFFILILLLFISGSFSRLHSFFHSEFNFRPSVGAWLPATGAKQRLVYANG